MKRHMMTRLELHNIILRAEVKKLVRDIKPFIKASIIIINLHSTNSQKLST